MSVAPGSTDASMADAAGTAEDAPPDKLDEAEHEAWKRCVALGGRDQFKLPDDELNARLTLAQRGTIRRNRRRDNRALAASGQPRGGCSTGSLRGVRPEPRVVHERPEHPQTAPA